MEDRRYIYLERWGVKNANAEEKPSLRKYRKNANLEQEKLEQMIGVRSETIKHISDN